MKKKNVALLLAVALVLNLVCTPSFNSNVQAATQQPTQVNLISNGNFNAGITGWGSFTAEGGEATVSAENGKLNVAVTNCGTVNYSVQAYHEDFQMYKNGVYLLKFDISSSIARAVDYRIQLNGGDYRGYVDGRVQTNSTTQTVSTQFTMKEANDIVPRLCFSLGNCGTALPAHTVSIDNVELILLDGSGIIYDEAKPDSCNISVNQIGYRTNDQKIAVFRGQSVGSTFDVVNASTGKVVYTGNISSGTYNAAAGETDYKGDFSSVTADGKYYITTAGLGNSYTFTIGNDVYANVFKDSTRFFYLQRCGEEITSSLASLWAHPICHTAKAKIYGTSNYIDVSGGWHDAGDYGRYVVATSKSVADLLLAYDSNQSIFGDNTNIPESGNGRADILDEIKGQLVWMLKMQNQSNGGVYHKVTCAGFPGHVTADKETAELIVCPISTQATGDFAAVMAMGYDTFKSIDSTFATTCLTASKKAWNYLSTAPSSVFTNPSGITTGEYGDKGDSDERYWAAAALYKATGDSKYHDQFKNYVNSGVQMGYDWGYVGSYGNALYLKSASTDSSTISKIKSSILTAANELLSLSSSDPYGVSNETNYYWGSNMATLNNANLLMDAYRLSSNEQYKKAAIEHINYCFGKNPMETSYVTAYGTISPLNPHHRPSMVANKAIPGALVGGPNKMLEDSYAKAYLASAAPAKCYLDNAESYSTNEVDIYWNSTLVYSLAQMDRIGDSAIVTPTTTPTTTPTATPTVAPTATPTVAPTATPTVAPTVAPTVTPTVAPTATPTTSPTTNPSGAGISVTVSTSGTNCINQTYQITATGTSAIDLSKLTIRYPFAKSDSKDMSFWCDNAAAQLTVSPWFVSLNSFTSGKIVKTITGYYVEITFNQAFTLAPNTGSVQLQTRLANSDWSDMSNFTPSDVIVLYNGQVVK